MPDNIISGKAGTIVISATDVPNIAKWSLTAKANINAHATNSTAGWKTRSAGTKDATGKIQVMQTDSATPTVFIPGTVHTVELHTDDSGTNYYSGDIMIGELSGVDVDINDGKEIGPEHSWGAVGALLANGNVPPLD